MITHRLCLQIECAVVEYRTTVILIESGDAKIDHACPGCGKIGKAP